MSDGLDVWVGLVEVRPLSGNDLFEGDPGAFANTLTVAADADDFRTRAANFFRGKGFEVASFEAVERLEDRDLAGVLPEEMRRLGELADETSQVQFDTYFTYGSTDE
ncbi:MAG: hypothetical protein QOE10_1442 [Gaiellales bacterium]|nr:hypothetical protein [Gaiellales bacterium]